MPLEPDDTDTENTANRPTRFRFYEPKTEDPSPRNQPQDINPSRFPFYDPSMQNLPVEETDNILRSLQETEIQRRNILNPESFKSVPSVKEAAEGSHTSTVSELNPYEDAIKEALDLLRKHRVDDPPKLAVDASRDDVDDLIAQSRTTPRGQLTETYEEQRLKAQQRQERMAQYASRLQEFKSSLPIQQEQRLTLQTSASADVSEITSNSHAEEVQRGVEKVLLAILERANNSRERTGRAEDDRSAMSDALAQALEGLNIHSKRSADTDGASKPTSVVDELLAEEDTYSHEEKKLPDNPNVTQDDDQLEFLQSSSDDESVTGLVLGPLSHEDGTSGVVLDVDNSEATEGSDEKCTSKTTDPCFDQHSTGAADRDSDNDPVTVKNPEEIHDSEANDLMLTLCAHFLPFGINSRTIEAIPDWDESNPNEAGYRIIRLTRNQLQRVELAFETMILGLKQKSQEQLGGEESVDAKFAHELLEVERLLDEAEAQKDDKAAIKANQVMAERATGTSPKLDVSLPEDGECHPTFPSVKGTGKGEMGDLEYFHLPIIFKSHVTGFEPTKDLILEPGNVVAGQYLVESELGSAAFSTAYRCIDLSTDSADGHEEVCLKVIKNSKDFFDQSLDEIKILELLRQTGRVQENHIVEMKCFFYYREHLVIVTELLRQNLFEFGKFILDNEEEPYFTIPRLAYISMQALISLRFVHSLGLVHSDVKPENILLSSYSRAQIKLIDFGSSCYLTDRQSSYIQSRSYRAPEVVLGLPYDGKIDVWSLGCVIAEMFTGEVTFQNDSIVSMLSRIEAICGPFPRNMIAQGRQSGRFFAKCGLLYEVVNGKDANSASASRLRDDYDTVAYPSNLQIDIFQPKNTRLSSRLGFEADLMEDFDLITYQTRRTNPERWQKQLFCDFVRSLLTVDPDCRPSAEQALQHPWMQYAATLTEEEIKYPNS